MKFSGDYFNAMDKESNELYKLNPSVLGVSTPPFKEQLESLRARIFQGASVIELGFVGAGKGSLGQGSTTPEMYGKDQREAIRQLAKVNDVTLSTHATVAAQGFAGFDSRSGKFSDESRANNLLEIERAIDFAAETTSGGPVVMHTGEFPVPIAERPGFETYKGEEKERTIYLVNKEDGKIIGLPKDIKIPEVERDEKGVPKVKPDGGYVYTQRDYKYYVDNQDRLNEEFKKEFKVEKRLTPEELLVYDFNKKKLEQTRYEHLRLSNQAEEARKQYDFLNSVKESLEKKQKENPKDAETNAFLWAKKLGIEPREGSKEFKEYLEDPMKFVNKTVNDAKNHVKYYEEGSISYGKNEEEIKKEITNIETIKDYALKKTADTLSTAAIYAYDKERAHKLEKPLFIAPENLFPEGGFGGHPQDLKEIILETRATMAKKLIEERKMNPEEANKIAQDHVKATFDIGHAYTWRKFFQSKPGESLDETDKRFKDYLMGEIKKLSDEGIIGHVHLADNFGYYDEHVTPGMGKAPIPEFVKQMQESGFKGAMITEPGSQDIQAMLGTWRILNSPVYRIDLTSRSWTDIEGSYFGRTGSPNYIVGDYAPSEDWTLWSGAKLE